MARLEALDPFWTSYGVENVAAAYESGSIVAECPVCFSVWTRLTSYSWWPSYDRCYICMREAAGVDRVMLQCELAAFRVAGHEQLSLFGAAA